MKSNQETSLTNKLEALKREVTPSVKRVLEIILEKGASTWLNALPCKNRDLLSIKHEQSL